MNKANQKFKSLLEKKHKIIEQQLDKIVEESKKDAIKSMVLEKKKCGCGKVSDSVAEEIASKIADKYGSLINQLSGKCTIIETTIEFYDIDIPSVCFGGIADVIEYLKEFNFSVLEKVDVLVYFINKILLYFENNDVDNTDALERFTSELKNGLNGIADDADFESYVRELFNENLIKTMDACENLRALINMDGELMPLKIGYLYKDDFDFISDLDEESVDLIIFESKRRDEKLKQLSKPIEVVDAKSKKIKTEVIINPTMPKISKEDKLKLKEANDLIKVYIKDGEILSFIDDITLIKLIDALNFLGYTENAINSLKKKILLSNQAFLEEEQNRKYMLAKSTYLTIEENNILNNIEVVLNDTDALQNPIFEEIKILYLDIKNILTTLSLADFKVDEMESSDEVGYVRMCIIELNNLLQQYKYSNYSLLLTKNSNND